MEDPSQSLVEAGPGYRPYLEVDDANPQTRKAWFSNFPIKPLNLKLVGGLGFVALIGLGAAPGGLLITLVCGGAVYGLMVRRRNANDPVPALRLSRMLEEQDAACAMARSQAQVDNAIDAGVWREAEDAGTVLSFPQASRIVRRGGVDLAWKMRIVTTVVTDDGLVTHATTWNALAGADRSAFSNPEYELIPWRSVSRARIQSGRMIIETVGGSNITVSVQAAPREQVEGEFFVGGDAQRITGLTNTFIAGVQARIKMPTT